MYNKEMREFDYCWIVIAATISYTIVFRVRFFGLYKHITISSNTVLYEHHYLFNVEAPERSNSPDCRDVCVAPDNGGRDEWQESYSH